MSYQDVILRRVNVYTRVGHEELSLMVMNEMNPLKFDAVKFLDALNTLVEQHKILQVCYSSPGTYTRVMYFPWGTTFDIGVIR